MQKVKGIKLACLAAFAILPIQAYGLGVGKLTMHSALDEPLNASIELTAVTKTELESLEISLGSVGVFNMAGIDRNELLKAIKFSVVKENGKNVIRMKTDQPFRDPFLHFIINATWANGSTLREYTALLDPPSYLTGSAASIKAPTVAAPVAVTKPAATKPSSTRRSARRAAMAAKDSEQASSPAPVDAPISPADTVERKLGPNNIEVSDSSSYAYVGSGNTYGPIKKGDVLWNIADDVRAGTSLGVNQVMIAIFMQNPDAFLHNNINLIRVGKTLQLPSSEEISSISRPAAQKEMRVQMDEWQAYKDGLSGARQTARVSYGDVTKDKPESIKKAADSSDVAGEKAMSEKPGRLDQGEDVLEIVRAKVDGADTSGSGASKQELARANNEISAYKENIGLLEESLASSELEKKELSERVLLLEQQIDKANKLIDMQSTDLAQLQGRASTAPIKPAEPEIAKLSAPDISPIAPIAPEIKKPPVVKKPVVKKPAEAKKKAVKTRVKPKPVEQKGMMDSVMDFVTSSWITMLGAVLAIVLVLVGLFVVLRRRRSIAEFEDSIISGTAVLDISTAESTEPSDAGSETSFLSDFVPGMGNMQADEVDPLAEAEVYMAYGRDEQAEEVLKDAASKNPDRHELKLKLLEIYQGRKDVSSFETLAEELYPADGNIPMDVWAKVAEMGKIVNPENPLFQGDLNVQEETLFGDKGQNEDKQLGDLLDTGSVNTEEAELMDALDEVTEEITEEVTEETPAPVDARKADDFPAPEEEVLDLDLGDFEPDEGHETDSFNLDSLTAEMNELEGDTEETVALDEGEIDFNLEGIDLDLGESEDTVDPALADTLDMTDLEGIEDLNLDLASEEKTVESGDDTSEVSIQDETLEFADLGDLSLPDMESDTGASEAETADSSSEMPAGANETWDEAGTKLDLARAYIEMDDNESAQSILEEVAKEGTDNQKNEARDLINQIKAG